MAEFTHVRLTQSQPGNSAIEEYLRAAAQDDAGHDGISCVEARSEGSPEGVRAGPPLRSKVLAVAGQLTSTPGDASAVTANARPLLAWLEAAAGEEDMEARWQALDGQYWNENLADDAPERFLAEAAKLYAFITAGQEG